MRLIRIRLAARTICDDRDDGVVTMMPTVFDVNYGPVGLFYSVVSISNARKNAFKKI